MRQQSPYLLSGPGPGPVARFLGALAAALALTLSMILGFVFFLIVLGVVLIMAVVVWAKIGRLRREMRAQGGSPTDPETTILDGDYEVLRDRERRDR